MICPKCGTRMNHHADKIAYSESADSYAGLGGEIHEIHACPRCGNCIASRSGSPEPLPD